jgi:lipopolysaccharide export system permease protein
MQILDKYIFKSIATAICMTVIIIVCIDLVMACAASSVDLNKTYQLQHMLLYNLLLIPEKLLHTYAPICVLIGTLVALGRLASNNEIIILQAAGISLNKLLLAVSKPVVCIIICLFIMDTWLVPFTSGIATQQSAKNINKQGLLSSNILYKNNNSYIHIQQVNAKGQLANLNIYNFNKQQLSQISHANSGQFSADKWLLPQVNTRHFSRSRIDNTHQVAQEWEANLSLQNLFVLSTASYLLPIADLFNYLWFIDDDGSTQHKQLLISFWKKLFLPLTILSLVVLALAFVLGPLRSVTMSAKVLTGIVVGSVLLLIQLLMEPVIIIASLPSILSIIIPIVLTLSLALWMLRRKN